MIRKSKDARMGWTKTLPFFRKTAKEWGTTTRSHPAWANPKRDVIFVLEDLILEIYFAMFPKTSTPAGGFAPFSGGVGQVIWVHVPEFPKLVLWLNSWNGPERGLPFRVPIQSVAPQVLASTVNARNASTKPSVLLWYELPTTGQEESPAHEDRAPQIRPFLATVESVTGSSNRT